MAQPDRLSHPASSLREDDDWETRALSRVAARVEDLPPLPAEADDFGWEEEVLQKLRQRLNGIE
jgi:hypothetical protein